MNPLPFPIVAFSLYDADNLVEDPRVPALAMLCTCGHDLGDHMADAPHACEACHDAILIVDLHKNAIVDPCRAFVSARAIGGV